MQEPDERGWREGVRGGLPYAAASVVLSLSFGVVAVEAGLPRLAAVVMSVLVFAGAAQFAAVGIIGAGGGIGAAVGAAALMNSRFVPMGFALGPSLCGSRLRRAVEGQAVVDSSWTMASNGDGTFDRAYLFGHTGVQYVAWVTGTAIGAFLPDFDARAFGLDAVFPAFFLALLANEIQGRRKVGAAVAGSLVALALVPVTPPGVPVLVAATVALFGLVQRRGAP